nr:hypothetical protein [Tanacetum cinerariifolium]
MAKQSLTKIIGDLKPVDDDDDDGVSTIDDSTIGSEDKDKVAMAKKLSTDVGQLSKDLSKLIKSNCLSNSQRHTMIDMCDTLHKDRIHLHNLVIRIEKEVRQLEQLKETKNVTVVALLFNLFYNIVNLYVPMVSWSAAVSCMICKIDEDRVVDLVVEGEKCVVDCCGLLGREVIVGGWVEVCVRFGCIEMYVECSGKL